MDKRRGKKQMIKIKSFNWKTMFDQWSIEKKKNFQEERKEQKTRE